jgi:hypothetical protein
LLIWGAAPSTLSVSMAAGQTLELRRCIGSSTSRNGSGIAAIVEDSTSGSQWLLTGDAGYHEIGSHPSSPVAIVVPHPRQSLRHAVYAALLHFGLETARDMGSKSIPPPRPAAYGRLFYSFGPGNKHGRNPGVQHPTAAAMAAHAAWNHGKWTGTIPGNSLAGHDVLATATHPATHLNGVAMGWSSAPTVPLNSFPCAVPGGTTGCTGTIGQA